MFGTTFENRSSECPGDFERWIRENRGDNSEQLDRLRRNLKRARARELTPRQSEMLHLFYDVGMTQTEIAKQLGVNCSTVCRTLHRAKDRLYRAVQYGL